MLRNPCRRSGIPAGARVSEDKGTAGFPPGFVCRVLFAGLFRRGPIADFSAARCSPAGFTAGFSSPGFRRRVAVAGCSLPDFCCRMFAGGFYRRVFVAGFSVAEFSVAEFSSPGLCRRVFCCRSFVGEVSLQGLCRRGAPDGTMLPGLYCDPSGSRRSFPGPSRSATRGAA